MNAAEIINELMSLKNDKQQAILTRFFKCGEGEYGYGDKFLGLKVPQTREIVKQAKREVSLDEIQKLLLSEWHEVRLCGFLLLTEEMKTAIPKRKEPKYLHAERRKQLAYFYLANAKRANNWDLVDLSTEYILGPYLLLPDEKGKSIPRDILYQLAESDNLWEQRIAIVTTLSFIRAQQFQDTIELAKKFLNHKHDLIHKATGWALREVGKRDKDLLIDFLEENYMKMPRTMLRYAIEKFPEDERLYWLKRPI